MKLLTILVLLSGLILGGIALRAGEPEAPELRVLPTALEGEPAQGNVQLAFEVEGMCCTTCPEKLRARVEDLAGVARMAIDPFGGRVEVEADAGVEPLRLAEAMTFDKYSAAPLD